MPNGRLKSLRNEDYTDRELLYICDDLSKDNDLGATTEQIAEQLGIVAPSHMRAREAEAHPKRCVATRFAWMRRWGWVERDSDHWRVTEVGHEIMSGKLTAKFEERLDNLKPGEMLMVLRRAGMAHQQVGRPHQIALRREWQHGTGVKR